MLSLSASATTGGVNDCEAAADKGKRIGNLLLSAEVGMCRC